MKHSHYHLFHRHDDAVLQMLGFHFSSCYQLVFLHTFGVRLISPPQHLFKVFLLYCDVGTNTKQFVEDETLFTPIQLQLTPL